MRSATKLLLFATAVLLWVNVLAYAEKFLPDDPLWNDPDQISIPEPNEIELSQIYDFAYNSFAGDAEMIPAENVNTLGEVPDSSWFTNRIGLHPMTIEDVVKGPNRREGPDISGKWTIIRAKTEGITPGFTIKDPKGDVYFIKFDPIENPQMATSADVICTKFFYAFGYYVPENYLARMRREMLEISENARIADDEGKKRKMTEKDVDDILRRVPKMEDGSVQVLASFALSGKPIGPFEYRSTRTDDANDVVPHENRRELRGLRVFAAWLNHDDSRSINTLNTWVTEGENRYIRHHLIDFGSTLGSGSVKVQSRRAGNEYMIEWGPMMKAAVTFGLWDRPWRKVKYTEYPSVGRFESSYFQPEKWKPEYPNPAFERMDSADALWATRIVMRFHDDVIRALVEAGQLTNPEAESHLIRTLIERRDKVIDYYLRQINPLYDFQIVGTNLNFTNLGMDAELASSVTYDYQWFRFDNQQNTTEKIDERKTTTTNSLSIPKASESFLMVRIRTSHADFPNWGSAVDVYIRNEAAPTVVGIDREVPHGKQ